MSTTSPDDDFPWKFLLTQIRHRAVVPVVGRELLVIPDAEGKPTLLDRELAHRLAEELGMDNRPLELRDVGFAWAQKMPDDREQLYSQLCGIVEELKPPVPEPLRQLAEITDLQLFISTTFDDLLARALDEVRGGGKAERRLFMAPPWKQSPKRGQEPLADLVERGCPVVYHVFGKASPRPDYAVTEADTLEFVHQLQTAPPQDLFDIIDDKRNLLFLGCGFPDWLSRFFVRAMKHQPLSGSRLATISDDIVRGEERLVLFLRQNQTRAYRAGGAADFVAKLHALWCAEHGPATPATHDENRPPPLEPLAEGGIFLSFASVDRDVVRAVKRELDRLNVPAWFDESDLEGGDAWKTVIAQSIERCWMFVPFISQRALAGVKRYFWKEWDLALEQAPMFAPGHRFIVPAALDDTPPTADRVPPMFRDHQWIREGAAPEKLAKRIQEIWRDNKRMRSP